MSKGTCVPAGRKSRFAFNSVTRAHPKEGTCGGAGVGCSHRGRLQNGNWFLREFVVDLHVRAGRSLCALAWHDLAWHRGACASMADVKDLVEVTLLFGRELKPGDAVLAGSNSDPSLIGVRLVAARAQQARPQQAPAGSLQERREAVRNRREAAEQARRQAEQQAATERDVWAQQAACLSLQRAVRRRLARALVQQRRRESAVAQHSEGECQQKLTKQKAAQAYYLSYHPSPAQGRAGAAAPGRDPRPCP